MNPFCQPAPSQACPQCGVEFSPLYPGTVYCSKRCGTNAYQKCRYHRLPKRKRNKTTKPKTAKPKADKKLFNWREYHTLHRAEIRRNAKKWRESHPMQVRLQKHARRIKIQAAKTDSSSAILGHISKSKNSCYWCGTSLKNVQWHIDHIVPIIRGGLHAAHNMVKSCPSCNLKKNDSMPNDSIRSGQLLLL